MTSMKTALLVPRPSRAGGGVSVAAAELAKAMAIKGVDVNVHAIEKNMPDDDREVWGNVPLVMGGAGGSLSYGFQPGLVRRLRYSHYNILHLQGLWTYMSLAAWRANGPKLPLIVSPHGMLDAWALANSARKKQIFGALYERRMIASAACLHALCTQEADSIRAFGYRGPIAVIPNGVELPDAAEVLNPPCWRETLPHTAKVLLFLGRIHPKKGLPALIEAFSTCLNQSSDIDDWHLVVAGWDQGGHQGYLKAQIETLRLKGRVHFVGPQFGNDKAATLQAADAFVLPSHSEGLPMAVLEAWSYGIPAVLTPACNLDEGFAASAAIRVEPTAESVAQGLRTLFAMPAAQRRMMSENAVALVKRDFDWTVCAEKMTSVYGWLYGTGPRPDCVRIDAAR